MKNLRLVIGIVVVLALVCSPVVAISKADLLAQYKGQSAPSIPGQSAPTIPIPTPTLIKFIMSPTPTPTPMIPSGFVTPTQTPTPSQDVTEPLQCTISLNSKPPGADVYLRHLRISVKDVVFSGDEYLGITPILIREIPIKNPDYQGCEWVRITVTKTGYKNATIDWPLCDGSVRTFSITLTPVQTTSESTEEDRYSFWFKSGYSGFLSF